MKSASSEIDLSADAVMNLRTRRELLPFFVQQQSPRILVIVSSLFLGVRIYLGGLVWKDALIICAVAALWHIQERLLHEYFLHLRAHRILGRSLLRKLSQHHRLHHRDPWRTQTLFITTSAYAFLIPTVAGVLLLLTRDIRLTVTGSFTYFATLLCYEWVHCLIHSSYTPRSRWYERRWVNHRLHHFQNRDYWFGITSPMWDTVLGSKPHPEHIRLKRDWRGPDPVSLLQDDGAP